jgi:hypothetical protein
VPRDLQQNGTQTAAVGQAVSSILSTKRPLVSCMLLGGFSQDALRCLKPLQCRCMCAVGTRCSSTAGRRLAMTSTQGMGSKGVAVRHAHLAIQIQDHGV